MINEIDPMKLFIRKPQYFDRKGQPLELLEWDKLFQDPDYKIVKKEAVGQYFISTVWIGINDDLFSDIPVIFETIIFVKDDLESDENDTILSYMDRYSTEEEALAGHEKAVKIAKGEILIDDEED